MPGQLGAILWKDLLAEFRTRDIVGSVLFFALVVVVVFSFALEPETVAKAAPGVLWVAFSFAAVLAFNRAFVLEKEKGCIEGLLLCPVERGVIYLGKMLASLLFLLVVEGVVLLAATVLFDISLLSWPMAAIALLASLGLAAAGTLFSAVAVNTRAREVMLPLLFLPVIAPLLIAAAQASAMALEGKGWGAMEAWLELIAIFDVAFNVLAFLTFEFILEE